MSVFVFGVCFDWWFLILVGFESLLVVRLRGLCPFLVFLVLNVILSLFSVDMSGNDDFLSFASVSSGLLLDSKTSDAWHLPVFIPGLCLLLGSDPWGSTFSEAWGWVRKSRPVRCV